MEEQKPETTAEAAAADARVLESTRTIYQAVPGTLPMPYDPEYGVLWGEVENDPEYILSETIAQEIEDARQGLPPGTGGIQKGAMRWLATRPNAKPVLQTYTDGGWQTVPTIVE